MKIKVTSLRETNVKIKTHNVEASTLVEGVSLLVRGTVEEIQRMIDTRKWVGGEWYYDNEKKTVLIFNTDVGFDKYELVI